MHALLGARRLLSTLKPKLFVEIGYSRLIKNGTTPNKLMSFLAELGYRVYHSETNEVISIDHDFEPLGDGGIDVYAIHEDESRLNKND
jgi:hypothetical protein